MRRVLLYAAGQSSFASVVSDYLKSLYDVIEAEDLEKMVGFLGSFVYDCAVIGFSAIYLSDGAFADRLKLLRERVRGNVVVTMEGDVSPNVEDEISRNRIKFLRTDYSMNDLEHALGSK